MEDNPAYGMTERNYMVQEPSGENVYELVPSGTLIKRQYAGTVERSIIIPRPKTSKSSKCCIAFAVFTAMLALMVATAGVVLNPVLNSRQDAELEMEVESLQMSLNQSMATIEELRDQINTLQTDTNTQYDNLNQTVEDILQNLIGSFTNPASSCSDIPRYSPSREYWIQNSNTNSPVQVYCDMNRTCCNTTGRWTRVANLDMTDPSQQCPDGFRLVNRTTAPLRTCGRPTNIINGCVSTTFPVHGIEYSRVCGRVIGYQFGSTEGFDPSTIITINDTFLEGVSLTHGQSPRQHIWAFAANPSETFSNQFACPCSRSDVEYTGVIPSFVGQDYFCDTGSRDSVTFIFYPDDPLWDGQGCGGTSTCCSFNNPPWFCKQLPQPTTDDIELRLCGDQVITNEDTPLEIVEIYVK